MKRRLDDLLNEVAEKTASPDPYVGAIWELFDLLVAETNPDNAVRLAESGMEKIGSARGVKAASLSKYRQRGRGLVLYQDEIALLPRAENPLGLVQRKAREAFRSTHPATELDLDLINAVLNANATTQEAIIELLRSGRLSDRPS